MRFEYCLLGLLALAVEGCHQPSVSAPNPTDAPTLLADVRAKFDRAGAPDEQTSYDLRQPNGPAALAEAVKPYTSALDEADGLVAIKTYGKAFAAASELVDGSDSTVETPAQKAAAAPAVFSKVLLKALIARARLRLASANMDLALKDFGAAAQIVHLSGEQPGSTLGLIIHVADQAVVLNALRYAPMDLVLTATDAKQLAKVAAGLEDEPDWQAIVAAEIGATKKLPYAKSKRGTKDLAEWARVSAILKEAPSLAAADRKLRTWVGNADLPTDVQGLKDASNGLFVATVIEQELRGNANSRMTAAALEAFAAENAKGEYPRTMPKTYKTADPFDPGGRPLVYVATPNGFTITSTHSRGIVRSAAAPAVVAITYPPKSYLPARL